MRFAYYPGCNAEEISKQLDNATRVVSKKLDIDLIDVEEFNCCGSGALEDANSDLNLTVNARNFAIAEKKGLDIVTICSTCYNVMRKAQFDLLDKENLSFVNKILKKHKLTYKNKVKILHYAELINKKEIANRIRKLTKNPISKNIASFYGCHLQRPSDVLRNNREDFLENSIKLVGAKPIDTKSKDDCCGLHISLVKEKNMLKMTGSIVNEAKEQKADIILTLCTLCHFSLDANQIKSQRYYGKLNIPVLFLPQLIGLAIGLNEKELGIDKNIIELK